MKRDREFSENWELISGEKKSWLKWTYNDSSKILGNGICWKTISSSWESELFDIDWAIIWANVQHCTSSALPNSWATLLLCLHISKKKKKNIVNIGKYLYNFLSKYTKPRELLNAITIFVLFLLLRYNWSISMRHYEVLIFNSR